MKKKRILLIDDEPDFTHVLKLNLEETGEYQVIEENRPEHVLPIARAFKPHLILLDVVMPHVHGGEIAEKLRADEALKDTPVVFLTGVVSREETERRHGVIGGHPFIAKPVSIDEVLLLIEKYLQS
jgi:DNA-binding response OmpR family regulator